jgi:hypothetical protein
MSDPLADALLTIGGHPLCSVTVEQGDELALTFFIENDETGDSAREHDLEATLALYDETGHPYRLAVFLPQPSDDADTEPDGWQAPTVYERNSFACR